MDDATHGASSLIHGWTRLARRPDESLPFRPFARASGSTVTDTAGTEFLDARSLVWNVSFGHEQRSIGEAVAAQFEALACGPTIDGQTTMPAERLGRRLIELTSASFAGVYLSLSGSAANEVAIAIARGHFQVQGRAEKSLIVSLRQGYHGQSFGTLPLAGISVFGDVSEPGRLGYASAPNCYCYRCPHGRSPADCAVDCAEALIERVERLGPDRVAALILEPVQGSLGAVPPPDWFRRVADYLHEAGILLIVDEVANGFGRLGADFAFRAFGLEPDLLTLAKAITNGALPLAATLATERVMAPLAAAGWTPRFGSTQDGNPVCAAAANAVLDLFAAQDWGERATRAGAALHEALCTELGTLPNVGDIRGIGLFRAVELVEDRVSKRPFGGMERLFEALKAERLLVHLNTNIVILAPPLTTPEAELRKIARRLARALDTAVAQPGP